MAVVGKGNKDASALTREITNMCVPGKMPIKGEVNIFHFVAGCQTRTTV